MLLKHKSSDRKRQEILERLVRDIYLKKSNAKT